MLHTIFITIFYSRGKLMDEKQAANVPIADGLSGATLGLADQPPIASARPLGFLNESFSI